MKVNYWAGGYHYNNISQFDRFIKDGIWQIGWESDQEAKRLQNYKLISQIRVGDYFALKSLGGQHDLKIKAIGKVTDISRATDGIVRIDYFRISEVYSGKAPSGDGAGNWFNTLLPVTRLNDISLLFHNDAFLKSIKIHKVRHLKDIDLQFDITKKQNLILTGKNGSGKTSLLEAISDYLNKFFRGEVLPTNLNIELNNVDLLRKKYLEGTFIIVYLNSYRFLSPIIPESVEKFTIADNVPAQDDLSSNLLKFLVKVEFEKLYAYKQKDEEKINEIENWYQNFTEMLKEVFEEENLKLEFNISDYSHKILIDGKEPFDFRSLPSGFSSILKIISEIMLRIEFKKKDTAGIIIIDEIDVHLHLKLQEKILPFLVQLFPDMQFIVSTHSPFVLNSISSTFIYDLESKMKFLDASNLSYSGLIESYFKVNSEYSTIVKDKIKRFESLLNQDNKSSEEFDEMMELESELDNLSPILSAEIFLYFKNLKNRLYA